MKFKDVNGDGKINGDDQVRLDQNLHQLSTLVLLLMFVTKALM
jgi:hypothetical protein